MLYTHLFGKTQKQAPSDAVTASHKLLHQAGYIRESTAGRYFFLPLGIRVQQKIMKIIKEAMDATGAQEMVSPVLHPLDLWKETNRNNETGFELTTLKDRREAEFALGGTAEEMFVDCIRKFQLSYRDLPLNLYQFSTKFRDEMRARGGLLRVREFIMKDAYSFDTDEKSFKIEYKKMWDTYLAIYKALGLDAVVVESDNGYIGGEYCHEFIVESEVGESKFFVSEDRSYAAHEDIATFSRGQMNHDEAVKPLEHIDQPAWVQTMEHNEKHYKEPKWRFLKNVVYKIRTTGQIVIAVIRGDLDVNKTKLEHVLNAVGQLDDATDADLAKIGTKRGYVHSWGHTGVTYIGDLSLESVRNFIGGQKEETTDTRNVNYGRDFSCEKLADIALAKEGYMTADGKSKLLVRKGIEVGNIFQLGYHYTSRMQGAVYVDEDGKEKPYYMGCYGIGVGRTLATIVETYHDERGIKWPIAVAPFHVQLVGLDLKEPEIAARANEIYETLTNAGIEVLFDDRTEASAGFKFADADLIGNPIRLVVSKKTGDKIEYKRRGEKEMQMYTLDEVISTIKAQLS